MTETFPIVPANTRALWVIIAVVGVVVLATGTMLFLTTRGARHSRFEVSDEGLRLHGDLYGRLLPPAVIRTDWIRLVNLAHSPELVPVRRTAGTDVGGYQSGWFKLRNGEKALVYLTDRSKVVYVPTAEGYSLLLSAQEPEKLVARLRALGPPRPR